MECGKVGKMYKLLPLLLLVSCGLPLSGPSNLVFEIRENAKAPLNGETKAFQNFRQQILDAKCVKCHKNFTKEENLLKYISKKDPDSSKLFEVVKNGSMPKKAPPLTTLELEMVRKYIENVEVIEDVTFAELNEKILTPKCLKCHKKMGDEAILNEKWIDLKSPFNSKLYLSTLSGEMPKKSDPLSKAEMNIIKGYLKSK